jgi:hypothetical protein
MFPLAKIISGASPEIVRSGEIFQDGRRNSSGHQKYFRMVAGISPAMKKISGWPPDGFTSLWRDCRAHRIIDS